MPRPDGKSDNLGLTMLDEPSVNQSDSTVLDLQLRAISKQIVNKEMVNFALFLENLNAYNICLYSLPYWEKK